MDKTQIITLVLGSAAIGALVSGIITFAGQALERKSRRAELILSEAIRLTEKHMDVSVEIAKARAERSQDTLIMPIIESVADYHGWLKSLLENGTMPSDYIKMEERMKRHP